MWIRDQLGEWHLEGGVRVEASSVVYTRRGQPRSVSLGTRPDRAGTATVCGRRVDPGGRQYERAPVPDAMDRRCRTCRDAGAG